MKTKKERMYSQIVHHGELLKELFCLPSDTDPVKLCKKLRKIESKAHREAELWCNGEIDEKEFDTEQENNLASVYRVLRFNMCQHNGVFVNSDPRGYALKCKVTALSDNKHLMSDWGGYGILAPEFTGEKWNGYNLGE